MKKIKAAIFCLLILLLVAPRNVSAVSQTPNAQQRYIIEIGTYAQKYDDVFYPSVTIAQAILETGWGKSDLAKYANNHFGIKATKWNGATYDKVSDEYVNGKLQPFKSTFRKYSSLEESVQDHAIFLTSRGQWYIDHYQAVIQADSYQAQANALAGTYCTDPYYGKKLIQLIEAYHLDYFDDRRHMPNFYLNYLAGEQPKVSDSSSDQAPVDMGWQKADDIWKYKKADGQFATGWVQVDGTWYYLKSSGAMATGWVQVDGTWYYLKSSGAMATGWAQVDGTWYYLKSSGAMATGWVQVDGTWYYLKSSGAMATGWAQVDGTWYYLKSSGAMATGWAKVDGTWYYLKSSGAMATGWAQVDGTWYYLKSSGAMAIGWEKIAGVWYQFAKSGAWL